MHNLLGTRVHVSMPTWESWIEPQSDPFIADHKIQGATVYPGAAYIEMALAAVQEHERTKGKVFPVSMEWGDDDETRSNSRNPNEENDGEHHQSKVQNLAVF